MEIKVNDYVRTKEGYICKILKLNEPRYDDGYLDFNDIDSPRIHKSNIVKSRPRIIDLIEAGDYVNGHLVSYVGSDSIEVFWYKDEKQWLDKEEIKSIVTKEQFEQMEYKIN